MMYYSGNADFRQEVNKRIGTLFDDVFDDEMDSFSTSIHLNDGDTQLVLNSGSVHMYHRNGCAKMTRHAV